MTHDTLEDRLGFAFRSPELLSQALTHRSFGAVHNERLEFIGDAVLDCAIAAILYRRFPRVSEGELSRMRAHLVNGETLARLGAALGLGDAIRLGEGELRSGGATRPSILADALEAIIGAAFLDTGFDAAHRVVESVFAAELAGVDPLAVSKDPKTRLQEWLQARKLPVPEYIVTEVSGEAHAQTFAVECRIAALAIAAAGTGASRRAAEQAAADAAFVAASMGPGVATRG